MGCITEIEAINHLNGCRNVIGLKPVKFLHLQDPFIFLQDNLQFYIFYSLFLSSLPIKTQAYY